MLYIFLSVSQNGYILPLDFCSLSLYEPENFCHRLPEGIHFIELEIVTSVALDWCCRGVLTPIFLFFGDIFLHMCRVPYRS